MNRPVYNIEDEEAPLYQIEEERAPRREPQPEPEDDDDDEDESDDDEDEEEIEDSEAVAVKKTPSPLWVMFKTMIGPVEGWKALKRARFRTDEFASRCFYPLIALAALSDVSMLFYEANLTAAEWAKAGLCTFITFFFGYFTILMLGGVILPAASRQILKKDIGRQFVMLALSTLALFLVANNLLPMFSPVLVFLPLWTIYMVFKGIKILRVPQEATASTTGLLCMLIIGVPVLWDWIMSLLLNI